MLTDLAGAYLVNAHLLGASQTLASQLQHALDSRIIIEQAKGVIAGRHGLTPDSVFEVIRSHARGQRVKIHDVARAIVSGQTDPIGEVASAHGESNRVGLS